MSCSRSAHFAVRQARGLLHAHVGSRLEVCGSDIVGCGVRSQERAAYKVNRWMGGGYVPVYDLGSGR
eukprot:578049-Rhodomonas_salina.2